MTRIKLKGEDGEVEMTLGEFERVKELGMLMAIGMNRLKRKMIMTSKQ